MGGDVNAAAHAFDLDVVHVQNLGRFGGDGFQAPFQPGVVQEFVAGLDGGGLALDVGEDGRNFRHVLANFGFEDGDAVVSFFQAEILVEFEVLFHVQASLEILHADVVDVEIVASGDSADAIENILGAPGPRQGVHDHVSVRQHFMDRAGHGFRHLFGALEGHVAGHANREIGKVAVAGTANADAVHLEQAIDGGNRGDNLVADSGGSSVEQGVNRPAGQARAYVNHHAR